MVTQFKRYQTSLVPSARHEFRWLASGGAAEDLLQYDE